MDSFRFEFELCIRCGKGAREFVALGGLVREHVLKVVLGALQCAQFVGQSGDLRGALGKCGVLLFEFCECLVARDSQPRVLLDLSFEVGLQLGIVQLALAQCLRGLLQRVLDLGRFSAQAFEK